MPSRLFRKCACARSDIITSNKTSSDSLLALKQAQHSLGMAWDFSGSPSLLHSPHHLKNASFTPDRVRPQHWVVL